MRALLTPDFANQLGLVIFRPGTELMPLFRRGRVLIQTPPASLNDQPAGVLPSAVDALIADPRLKSFYEAESVGRALNAATDFAAWLVRDGGCQWPHSDYHHHEMTFHSYPPAGVRLCWHCDNRLREQTLPQLQEIATLNRNHWMVSRIKAELGLGSDHELTMPELCWWAVVNRVADALPESAARAALRMSAEVVPTGPQKETDLVPPVAATDIVQEHAAAAEPAIERWQPPKPQVRLPVDPESPETFMKRPRRRRWDSAKYLQWVKTQPCVVTGKPADDAHHLIGHGQGGMGTKAHDLFTFPLSRGEHTALHNDPVEWERQNGTQLEWVLRTQDRALALGVLG
ncbi:hypothetical protein TUM12370_24620 [Salmonella enterica subsp. enterica serovar Choleraesuis]|nr:hypothetical protein TUM12370_24620 [Salmonella enterica subsp. enterica serovar Choleraesuis]